MMCSEWFPAAEGKDTLSVRIFYIYSERKQYYGQFNKNLSLKVPKNLSTKKTTSTVAYHCKRILLEQ